MYIKDISKVIEWNETTHVKGPRTDLAHGRLSVNVLVWKIIIPSKLPSIVLLGNSISLCKLISKHSKLSVSLAFITLEERVISVLTDATISPSCKAESSGLGLPGVTPGADGATPTRRGLPLLHSCKMVLVRTWRLGWNLCVLFLFDRTKNQEYVWTIANERNRIPLYIFQMLLTGLFLLWQILPFRGCFPQTESIVQ